MASKRKSTWGKSADWNAPKSRKKTTWGTPEDVARAVSKRTKGKSSKGGKLGKLFGPLW